ncbi:hypothetical protein [Mycobacteroides salmoniphilum]|uniref:hypothetical protein n=1 Tax=Mycobacteroides salmoniphilum TaxID=404941 RepID=UPI000993C115|nr:hypothetical protein [Mycobacteroides salmoniphilum]QCH25556.1 hypothetical protein DSM43276_03834 [Mycobacteroides salmoniphilum]
MTDSDDTQRPVSVAELLARNGAADGKISGHRRRMRGNADAIPVAELTGEIPVIRDKKGGRARPNPAPTPTADTSTAPETPKAPETGARSYLRSNEDALFGGDSMADEAARRGPSTSSTHAQPSSMASPLRSIFPPTPTPVARPGEPRKSIDFNDATGVISPITKEPPASEPTPAPRPAVVAPTPPAAPAAPAVPVAPVSLPEPVAPEPEPEPEPESVAQPEAIAQPETREDEPVEALEAVQSSGHGNYTEYEEGDEYEQYGHAPGVEWTSHDAEQDVEDDEFEGEESHYQLEHELQELMGAHGGPAEPEANQLADVGADTDKPDAEAKADRREKIKTYLQGSWIAAQYLLAAAAGAGLFFGFRELWSWNQGIALVLGVLFIAILVASLWVIRKTVDLVSILIAIVVGALIAFGPLVLMLQSVD